MLGKTVRLAISFTPLLFAPLWGYVLAHEGEIDEVGESTAGSSLQRLITDSSLLFLAASASIAIILVIVSILVKEKSEILKRLLFGGIALPIILASLYLAGSTIYLNLASSTGGPVHWHADFEIWVCGEKVDLLDPTGLSNRVGTATFHEHGDSRIHVEGVVIRPSDASLGNFFRFVGGRLTNDSLAVTTNEGVVSVQNGDRCPNQGAANLQVFVYQTKGQSFTQKKLTNLADYIISPHGVVPPGDCIIVEFGPSKPTTDRLCQTYGVQVEQGELHGP